MSLRDTLALLVLALGGLALVARLMLPVAPGTRADRRWLALCAVFAAGGALAYPNFGAFHQYGPRTHTFHYFEIYNYYVGSKYYPELGYERLYDCTYVAFHELGDPIRGVREIRSLALRDVALPAGEVLRTRAADCHARFSPRRWLAFRADLAMLLHVEDLRAAWPVAFFDLGFNAPPTWNLAGCALANLVPLSPATMEWLPAIDLVLLLVVAALLIGRAFGGYAVCGWYVVVGTNWLASYHWTGGSFLRHLWIVALVAGAAALERRRHRLAGAALALATAARIFPAVFAVGAAVSLVARARRDRAAWPAARRFVAAFALTLALLVAASAVAFGPARWLEFAHIIVIHARTLFVMHLGYRKMAVFTPAIGHQDFWFGPGLRRFVAWQARLDAAYAAHAGLHAAVQLGAAALALAAVARLRPAAAALVGGGVLLYFFAIPANYYYVYLALLPAVLFAEPAPLAAGGIGALVALLAITRLLPSLTPDDIVQNGWINRMLFVYFVALPAGALWARRRVSSRTAAARDPSGAPCATW